MHFYSITVVIICKFFEVVKSNIIILMADCNNYLHTLSKKKIVFWISSFLAKTKGGAGHQVPKKRKILGQQKFLADGMAWRSKNQPNDNFGHIVPLSWRNFNFNQKQKSYAYWKLCNAEKSKIMVAPPLWYSMSKLGGFVLRCTAVYLISEKHGKIYDYFLTKKI